MSALCAAADSPRADSTQVGNDPKFGDSSWVAPNLPPGVDTPVQPGPRVQSPDHQRTWETVLRTPFRVVFYPLRLLARGSEVLYGHFGTGVGVLAAKPPPPGPRLGIGAYAGSTNDVALGPMLKWSGLPNQYSRLSLFAGWSLTDHRRVRFSEVINDRRPVGLRLLALYDLKPNRRYYGIGNETSQSDKSFFLLENTSAELGVLLGSSPLRQFRLVGGYSGMSARLGYNGQPHLEHVFDPATVPGYYEATYDLFYGVTGDLAVLDDEANPSRGLHGRMELRHATGLRDKDPDYNAWLLEGRAYLPVFSNRRVIALRSVYSGVDPTANTASFPFYRLASNEGPLAFAGYPAYRYRDKQLGILRAEYRWVVWERQQKQLSAVALYELNQVAPFSGAFRLADAHRAWGGGFRLGLSDRSTLRLDLSKATEGLHANLQYGVGF